MYKRSINLKILLSLSLVILIIITARLPFNFYAKADGKAEIVMEVSQGLTMYEKNSKEQLPMASTTKIMTALITIEDCDLDEEITVDDRAVCVEGSSIYLKHGEKISIRDLVYGLMLRSGNDSATALAIHHSGSVKKFVDCMNDRAKELGLNDTHFANPSGLPDENHYTTASDLCKLACAAMANQTFKEVVSTKNYEGQYRSFLNKNKMLTSFEGANGVKTGYTVKAGRCLVSSAERDGMEIVCVVLNCPDMYERSKELLTNCFDIYKIEELNQNKIFMSDIAPCTLDGEYKILVNKNKELQYKIITIKTNKKIKKGDLVAKLEIYSENDLIFCQNLYSIIAE
jgi:D-alanyl-D-alanine carboxypeptidase (penicillin-binding protein 5/6)